MVHGYHIILSAYGFWLPNDPRGSWSEFVRSWELSRFGEATKVDHGRSVARVPHDRDLRLAAKQALKYPAVRFTGEQAVAIAKGFGRYVERSGVTIWACAILPEHVHLVLARLVALAGSLWLIRPRLISHLHAPGVPSRTEALIGRQGVVTQDIDALVGAGRVNVGGEDRAARAPMPLPAGTTVRVTAADGIVYRRIVAQRRQSVERNGTCVLRQRGGDRHRHFGEEIGRAHV